MAKVRIINELEDVELPVGAIVEVAGPVTDEIQEWLTSGDAELLDEEVGAATPTDPRKPS
jgi:hypothetical protein